MLNERPYMRNVNSGSGGSLLWPIIVLNIIVFVLCQAPGGSALDELFKLHPYYLHRMQFWRLLTYQFCHASVSHIFWNMWGLYIFGRGIEALLGSKRFAILYLLSGAIGGLLWSFFNMDGFNVVCLGSKALEVNDYEQMDAFIQQGFKTLGGCVGASGSLFGVMTAAAMAFPNTMVFLLFPPIPMKMRTMIIVYMLIEVFSLFNSQSSVAHLAHLGGALGGFIFMKRLKSKIRDENSADYEQRSYYQDRREVFGEADEDDSPIDVTPNSQTRTTGSEEYSEDALQQVLDKISRQGYNNLTAEELRILAEASKRQHRR